MFAPRYFPSMYFPVSYFPEVGAGLPPPPPGVLGQINVKINGVVRSHYCYDTTHAQAMGWTLVRGNRGQCSIPFYVPPGDPFAPQLGELIEIFDPLTARVWAGTTEQVEIKWFGDDGWKGLTVTGVSLERYFDTVDLGGIKYGSGVPGPVSCGDVLTDAFIRSGVTEITLGVIQSGPDVEALSIGNVWTGFQDLATFAGFYVYIDPLDMTLNFHAPLVRPGAFTMGGAGDFLYETLDWKQSRSDVRDQQVIQSPGQAQQPITASFPGDGVTTEFTLSEVPLYIVSIAVVPTGNTGKTISNTPGTATIRVEPAMLASETLQVRYMDQGTQTASIAGAGVGGGMARYTKTRTWTAEGGLQEANALLARYSLLPSSLTFSTDRPGVQIGRTQVLNVLYPAGANLLLNGTWLPYQIQASVIPGLDMQEEPWGHFRYQVSMVNAAATAVFQGDGATTTFILPTLPSAVDPIVITAVGLPGEFVGSPPVWTPFTVTYDPGTGLLTIEPPLPPGDTGIVTTIDPSNPGGSILLPGDGSTTSWTIAVGSPPVIPTSVAVAISNLPDLGSTVGFTTDPTTGNITGVTVTPATCDTLAITYSDVTHNPSYDVVQGNCTQTNFPLSQPASAITSVMNYAKNWETATDQISITPALPPGSMVYASYTGNQQPDVVNNYAAWAQLTESPPAPTPVAAVALPPSNYVVGLLLKDLTVGDDIADHVTIYHDGTALRLLGVLRKLMTADLTIRVNKRNATFTTEELITATIPVSAVVDQVFEWSLASGSPPTLPPFLDKEVLSFDILESDGSKDVDGIASFTVEWEQTN